MGYDPDSNIHPDAGAGGGGPGFFRVSRQPGPLGCDRQPHRGLVFVPESTAIIHRIDRALAELPQIGPGLGDYAALVAEFERWGADEAAFVMLRGELIDLAAARYRGSSDGPIELVEFNDGAFEFLFDRALERTILVHGFSRAVPPNTRDASYHRGFPGRPGYDKGHAMAHAQGGREGGPNYFPQLASSNRRLSDIGNLWRDIETYLARNAGVFAFVRLLYDRGNGGVVPDRVEYGLLDRTNQFRAVVFPNRANP
jgi:hypothetical protein